MRDNEYNRSYDDLKVHDDAFQPEAVRSVNAANAFLNRVYGWMCLALALTGATAWIVAHQENLLKSVLQGWWLLLILELGLVIGLTAAIRKLSPAAALIGFLAYSVVNGATLSLVLLAYTEESVAGAFFAASLTFGVTGLIFEGEHAELASSLGKLYGLPEVPVLPAGATWEKRAAAAERVSEKLAANTRLMTAILRDVSAEDGKPGEDAARVNAMREQEATAFLDRYDEQIYEILESTDFSFGGVTLLVVIPGILLLANLTNWGPVLMYGVLKLTDFVKIVTAHLWLKKEKWVKNLTVQAA